MNYQKDRILWLHNKTDGEATTQLAYNIIASSVYGNLLGWQYKQL